MKRNFTKLEDYLEQVELLLLGYPKKERNYYLEELADGLVQQFHDYCKDHEISPKKTSSYSQYIQTLDEPGEVAQQFARNLNVRLPFLIFPLQLLKSFEKFISRKTVLSAWLIGFTLGFLPFILEIFVPWLVELFTLRTSGELGNEVYYMTETSVFFPIYTVLIFIVLSGICWRVGRNSQNPAKVFVFATISLYTYFIPSSLSYLLEGIDNLSEMINSSSIHITSDKSLFLSEYWEPLHLLVRNVSILLSIILACILLSVIIVGVQHVRKTPTSNWRKILGLSLTILTILAFFNSPLLQVSALKVEPDSRRVYNVESTLEGQYPPDSSYFEYNETYATQCWILGNLSILWDDYITINITNSPSVHFQHLIDHRFNNYDDYPGNLDNGTFIWIWPFTTLTEWKTHASELNGTFQDEILIQANVHEDSQIYVENHTSVTGRMDLVVDLESRLPTLIILKGDFTMISNRDTVTITHRYAYVFPIEMDLTSLFIMDLAILAGLAIAVTLAGQGTIWINGFFIRTRATKNTK